MSCSTLALIHFSPTNPIPCLTIQNILAKELAKSKVTQISGIRFGIFGAGGKVGKAKSTFGINDGKSGNVGGLGKIGIFGILRLAKRARLRFTSNFVETLISGGDGKLGIVGKAILIGTKRNLGNCTVIHKSI